MLTEIKVNIKKLNKCILFQLVAINISDFYLNY